jgi:hypothetical protein
MKRSGSAARGWAFLTPTFLSASRSFDEYPPEGGEFVEPWPAATGSDPGAVSRSRLSNAIAALQDHAQSLDLSLPAFGDPLTAADVDRVRAYIGAVQLAVDRLCQVVAPGAGPTRV